VAAELDRYFGDSAFQADDHLVFGNPLTGAGCRAVRGVADAGATWLVLGTILPVVARA
jgi:hypothetical protein